MTKFLVVQTSFRAQYSWHEKKKHKEEYNGVGSKLSPKKGIWGGEQQSLAMHINNLVERTTTTPCLTRINQWPCVRLYRALINQRTSLYF